MTSAADIQVMHKGNWWIYNHHSRSIYIDFPSSGFFKSKIAEENKNNKKIEINKLENENQIQIRDR